jgi:membrane protein DedA with SNARE-associated domain
LARAETFFERRGPIIVAVARFINILRQTNGLIAGIIGMHWRRFLVYNIVGAVAWVGTWSAVGYFAGNNLTIIYHWLNNYAPFAIAAVVVLIVGFYLTRRYLRNRRSDEPLTPLISEQTEV